MSETALDLAALRGWIGKTEIAQDSISPRLVSEYTAMLDLEPHENLAPLALHWCLAPPAVPASALERDGHPARGGFLPPVPLPRRMWAGGQLRIADRLLLGDAVKRQSRIADVSVKQGHSGLLCFVTVEHELTTYRGSAITERQDIVYRPRVTKAATAAARDLPAAAWEQRMRADPVLLFRYSALTFNGHRIHYDRTYATEVEHYPGLVVHGPLQATWLLEFATRIKGSAPSTFDFRGLNPLFDFATFRLGAREADNCLRLWIQTSDGIQTMEALAQWR